MKFTTVHIFLLLVFLGMIPSLGHAQESALFFVAVSVGEVAPGGTFTAQVFVDTEKPLNVYRVTLTYPSEILTLLAIDNGKSRINFWQTTPRETSPGVIEFAGGSVPAFQGRGGELLTLQFRAEREGAASLIIENAEAYVADGRGAREEVKTEAATVAIREGALPSSLQVPEDTEPPVLETIVLLQDPFHKERRLLSFSVRDSGSGIQRAIARFRRWFSWSEWEAVENPAAVESGVWAIEFRAYDNRNNLRAEVLYYWPPFLTRVLPLSLLFVGVCAGLLLGGYKYLQARRKKMVYSKEKL